MRLPLLQKELSRNRIDSCLLINYHAPDPTLFYFAGIELEHAILLVDRNSATLFVPKLEAWRAKAESGIRNVQEMPKTLEEFSRTHLSGNVGANLSVLPAQAERKLARKGVSLKDASALVHRLREVKTDEEVGRIRKACAVSDEILSGCISRFARFKTEGDAKKWLKKAAIDRGCELAFPPIVASGKHAALPHYSGAERLCRGFCVLDFGVRYRGYCSDTTRTLFIGRPGTKERKLYAALLACQEEAIESVTPGLSMAQLERTARKSLGTLEKHFIHRLGHSVGIEVHDPLGKETPLEQGMVVTVEPGLYFHGTRGMRIEDTVLVRMRGCEALTRVPKELVIV